MSDILHTASPFVLVRNCYLLFYNIAFGICLLVQYEADEELPRLGEMYGVLI